MIRAKPVPGVYPNVPFSDYQAIEAWNNSALCYIDQSPAHAWHAWTTEDDKKSEALREGTCLHVLTLEPQNFDKMIKLGPLNTPKTWKPGDEPPSCYGLATKAWAEAEKLCPKGVTLVNQEMIDNARIMSGRLRECKIIADALHAGTMNEAVIVWVEQVELPNGRVIPVPLKVRIDALCSPHYMIDIKSMQDASALGFGKSVHTFEYHVQAAMYEKGAKAAFGVEIPIWFACVEKKAPWEPVACVISDGDGDGQKAMSSRMVGKVILRERLQKLAKCLATNDFPGYGASVQTVSIPFYARRAFVDGE